MKKIEITGCEDCPMCDMNDMSSGYNCRMKKSGENHIKENKFYQPVTPDWCPINSNDVVFTMKKDKK